MHHGKGFACFCRKGIRVVRDLLCAAFASFAALRERIIYVAIGWGYPHHLRCNSLFISPAVSRMGINPTPTVAECSNVLIISVLHVLFLYEVNTVAKCSNVLIISVLHVLFLHEEAVCCNRAVPLIR